ncbi:LuxR C-terminal-related transcriptional regulator [Arthrobacter sp. ov118]|uniref:helix-turn-helix transcriptional regulator n=1 Tax=Arthrobacter sp. ov118 TaxID=1761747 RepID=UPI0008EAEBA5|nr:LuxR C-terminal-related transcriptional regulator [Arthrobacter sp. ov118]SFT93215.1 ATP-, maltotriose-and DNA-dependent transcriptional regulator MalT [Arthrobacter sp. ov118]
MHVPGKKNATVKHDELPHVVLNFVDRPRLDLAPALLSGERRVAAVWAAAGCGKTSLLRWWAQSLLDAGRDVYWLAGERTMDAPRLIAWLSARADDAFVFLDDIHISPAHGAIHAAIEAAAENVRIIVSGRFQPIGSLTFLEVTGAHLELRTADLAFTTDEIARFAHLWAVDLGPEAAKSLEARTGGWATGVALAMSWLQEADNPDEAIGRFSGDHRAVADYLVVEILDGLSPADREVLTFAAVREMVPLALAATLTGRSDAGSVLHDLSRKNALITEEPAGYRYHPVLLSFLKADARRQDIAGAVRRAGTAARWYAARDEAVTALELALDPGSEVELAEMLDRFGLQIVLSGRTDLALRALLRTDSETLASLVLRLLLEAPYFNDVERARHLMARAYGLVALGAIDMKWILVMASLKALTVEAEPDVATVAGALHSPAALRVREDNLALDLLASTAEAWCLHRLDRTTEAQKLLEDVALSGLRAGYSWVFMIATDLAATIAASICDWDRASTLDEQLVEKMPEVTLSPATREDASVLLASGARDYLVCDPAASEKLAALIAADPAGTKFALDVPARMINLLIRLDSERNPREALQEAHRLFLQHGRSFPRLAAGAAVRLVSLDLELHGPERAHESLSLLERILGSDSIEVALGRFALDVPARAGTLAEVRMLHALHAPARSWHSGAPITAWLLLAASAARTGRVSETHLRLNTALRLAERYRVWRPFLARHGEGVAMLKEQYGRFGYLDAVASTIIDAAQAELPPPCADIGSIQVLTRREHEILLELPIFQSVADIAASHMVSVNTVKSHVRNIYIKFGVTDRRGAVLVAQHHGLL